MHVQCLKCKGRGFCGRAFCPIYAKAQARYKVQRFLDKEDFLGLSPAPFVGRIGYPFVNVGILSPPEQVANAWEYDAPRFWASHNYEIPKIIDFRSSLINSRFTSHVRKQSSFLEISQEIGMASKPVELEIFLEKKPGFRVQYDAYTPPMGPNARLKKAEITSNPKIPRAVDKVVYDTDFKAQHAMLYLHERGFDENFLSKLLSVGTLGVKMQRKLVPTRWSITAVDDLLGRQAIQEIKQLPEDDCSLYYGNYLGNHYFVLWFSEPWSFELFETYLPKASWNVGNEISYMTDYEPYSGRTTYAENCAGGYYAARLPIAEKLREQKRQASVLALRFITGEYAAPLGVWVCREAARKAMQNKPVVFNDYQTMMQYARVLIQKKFGYDIGQILGESRLVGLIRKQTKLQMFF